MGYPLPPGIARRSGVHIPGGTFDEGWSAGPAKHLDPEFRCGSYFGAMTMASLPSICAPDTVFPFRTAFELSVWNPLACVLKWQTRSGRPSPFTSWPLASQNAKLASSPVAPNVSEVWSTCVTALNVRVERIATGILP